MSRIDADGDRCINPELPIVMRSLNGALRHIEYAAMHLGFVEVDGEKSEMRAYIVALADAPTLHLIVEERGPDGLSHGYIVNLWDVAVQVAGQVHDIEKPNECDTHPQHAPPGFVPVQRPGDGSRVHARN